MLTVVTTASNKWGLRSRANNHSMFLLVKERSERERERKRSEKDDAIISYIYPHSSYNDSLQTSNKCE